MDDPAGDIDRYIDGNFGLPVLRGQHGTGHRAAGSAAAALTPLRGQFDATVCFVLAGELHPALVARGDWPHCHPHAPQESAITFDFLQHGAGHAADYSAGVEQIVPDGLDRGCDKKAFLEGDRQSVASSAWSRAHSKRGRRNAASA